MKVKNKATRFIISFVLMCAMIITSAVPAFAAGAEDWSSSTKTYVGSMHMTDNNLTQVKTIKRTGTLHIVGHFYGEDAHAAVSPIRLTAQIRYAYGGAIGNASITKDDNRSGLVDFEVTCQVTVNKSKSSLMQVASQIRLDITDELLLNTGTILVN